MCFIRNAVLFMCALFISVIGLLFGVFDGHGGGACAQVVAKRLFHYITACLLPQEHLLRYLSSLSTSNPMELLNSYNDKVQFVDDVRELYAKSFYDFVLDLSKVRLHFFVVVVVVIL